MKELKCLSKMKSLSVKNSFDFVNKTKNETLADDEMMVSFDVSFFFPSIPVDIAINKIEIYLNEIEMCTNKKSVYLEAARLCMNQSFFQFREKLHKVERGTNWNMGNPLSPVILEFFMCGLDMLMMCLQ